MHFATTFKPQNYDLYFDLDRQQKHFFGKTTITGLALTETVWLHQKKLQITEVLVNGQPHAFNLYETKDALYLELGFTGKVTLEITYTAKLTDTMMGIYPSYYELAGQKKQLIGTQFETDAAREAFVCVDEPDAKATFDLAIKFDEQPGEQVLSNMPEKSVSAGVHYFETTPKMSTYLVCFVLGELQSKTTTTTSGIKVGVFSTKAHQPKELDFALDIAKRALDFFEDYYQTPYPLSHSWQVALPDFSAGAMENWGIITYREAYLLLDPDNTTLETKQRVATVIAHELAHQWFGDLVTMKWWDDLWLNESFANMMEYICINALEPSWKIWQTFQSTEVPLALNRDALAGVQSIYTPVEDPAEIDALFDSAIVYAKGARMLVMVRALIGDTALRLGLKQYFASHAYGNATGADLWQALTQKTELDLPKIMATWLNCPGYPVVSVKKIGNDLLLEQRQFFTDPSVTSDQLWPIPLMSNYPELPALMTQKRLILKDYTSLRQKHGSTLQLNVNNNAHFIVAYSPELLGDLLKKSPQTDTLTRFSLLQDLVLLAQAQVISLPQVLELAANFKNDHSQLVTRALLQLLDLLKLFVGSDTTAHDELCTLVVSFTSILKASLSQEPASFSQLDQELIQPLLLKTELYAKVKQVVDEQLYFPPTKTDWAKLPAEIRGVALKNMLVNHNSDACFTEFFKEYQQSVDPSYKVDLRQALTSSPKVAQLTELLANFKDPAVIKPQDLRAWLEEILANPVGQKLAWAWLKQNWNWLEETVGGDMEFTTYITVIGKTLSSPELYADFNTFFEPKLAEPGLAREINLAKHAIFARVNLLKVQQSNVAQALSSLAWYQKHS